MPPIRDSPNVIKQLVIVAKQFTRIDRMIFLRAKAVSLKPMSAHPAAERASPWADLNCSESAAREAHCGWPEVHGAPRIWPGSGPPCALAAGRSGGGFSDFPMEGRRLIPSRLSRPAPRLGETVREIPFVSPWSR